MKMSLPIAALVLLGGASGARAVAVPHVPSMFQTFDREAAVADRAPNLVPTIAWLPRQNRQSHLIFQDIEVRGAFPDAFSLRPLPTPPAAATFEVEGVRAAWGLVAATQAGRPIETKSVPMQRITQICSVELTDCDRTASWCDERECYAEDYLCPVFASEESSRCTLVAKRGNPALRNTPETLVKGMTDGRLVVYLGTDVPADSILSWMFHGGKALAAGTYLAVMRPYTEAEGQAVAACWAPIPRRAVAEYNRRNATSFADAVELERGTLGAALPAYEEIATELAAREGCPLMYEHTELFDLDITEQAPISTRIFQQDIPQR